MVSPAFSLHARESLLGGGRSLCVSCARHAAAILLEAHDDREGERLVVWTNERWLSRQKTEGCPAGTPRPF